MSNYDSWNVSGTYYEVCNCEAVCPCRQRGVKKGGRSTYGFCDFAISWQVAKGQAGAVDLSNLSVVLAGSYSDDEPRSPWRVILYVDETADARQRQALTDIFLGRAGGDTLRNFAYVIGEVYAVRSAKIELTHSPESGADGGPRVCLSRHGPAGPDRTNGILWYSGPRPTRSGDRRRSLSSTTMKA